MRTGCCCKLSKVLRRVLVSGANGSSLLWAIGALVLLSVVGTTVALMSPSALQSKLEQEAGMRAYYNANAGLNYIIGMQQASQLSQSNFSNFTSSMGSGNVVTYNLGEDSDFSFRLGNFVTSGVNGTYQVTSLVGSVSNATGGAAYGYVVYGGGKGNSAAISYVVNASSSTNGRSTDVLSGDSVSITATRTSVTGNVYGKESINVVEDTTITGNVVSNGSFTGGSRAKITGYLCADGNITLADSTVIGGDINAGGDVVVGSASKLSGSIYSAGSVTIKAASVSVEGSINAAKAIYLNSKAKIGGNVNAGTGVYFQDDAISVGGDVNSLSAVSFGGSVDTVVGSVFAKSNIAITKTAQISKNAYSGGKITISNNNSDGTCIAGVAAAIGTIATCTSTSCGSGHCYIGSSLQNQSSVQGPTSPTDYTSCAVKADPNPTINTLSTNGSLTTAYYFTGKNYYFSSINIPWGATLYFDLSKGDISIFCTGTVNFSGGNKIKISTDGITYKDMTSVDIKYAAKIYLESNGTMYVGYSSDWFGTLFSRKTLTFNGGNTIIGSYASLEGTVTIQTGGGYTVTYVQSNYARDNW